MNIVIPDLWQQEAVRTLREGRDVVIDAPTGAGKTYIFELLYPELREQAIYTVPTRALANDKLAEWRRQGWDVGIATGDLSWRTDARVVVATLETQKGRFLRRQGPRLLVVDEYQMIADELRGVNYELALALAPLNTQLLLMSGSVGNPQDVVHWLKRLGRDAALISYRERPVPLEEIDLESLPNRAPLNVRGFWPRSLYNALVAGMGPILIFAPRRNATEDMARTLAAALPAEDSLQISPEQEHLAGGVLSKLLRKRIAFHHSGLSYRLRAGLIEPLAKNGHLRIVVATMGLASGINFSMRSVMVMDTQYMAGDFEKHVQPDELLQMFGRAGRRGLDEVGYVIGTPDQPRLHNARSKRLKRANPIDWPSAIAVMGAARERGEDPFAAAMEFTCRLFSEKKIPLGVEHSKKTGPMPCGLSVDMERARFARRGIAEMRNSRREWEPLASMEFVPLLELRIRVENRWRPALSIASSLDGMGKGNLCRLSTHTGKRYGRELHAASLSNDGQWLPSKWLRKAARLRRMPRDNLESALRRLLPQLTEGGEVWEFVERARGLFVRLDYGNRKREARRDRHGVAISGPETREKIPYECENCSQRPWCTTVDIHSLPADAWRRLGLVESNGAPTVRGMIFSFFNSGEGFAVAAALEDEGYPVEEIIFDLANLRAGPRFAGDDSPYSGHLGAICQQCYGRADYAGYLSMGVPLSYGAGASEIVRDMIEGGVSPQKLLTDTIRRGDIERAVIEWRSLMKHIAVAPDFPNDRWMALKLACARYSDTGDRSILDLPPLLPSQMQRRMA